MFIEEGILSILQIAQLVLAACVLYQAVRVLKPKDKDYHLTVCLVALVLSYLFVPPIANTIVARAERLIEGNTSHYKGAGKYNVGTSSQVQSHADFGGVDRESQTSSGWDARGSGSAKDGTHSYSDQQSAAVETQGHGGSSYSDESTSSGFTASGDTQMQAGIDIIGGAFSTPDAQHKQHTWMGQQRNLPHTRTL